MTELQKEYHIRGIGLTKEQYDIIIESQRKHDEKCDMAFKKYCVETEILTLEHDINWYGVVGDSVSFSEAKKKLMKLRCASHSDSDKVLEDIIKLVEQIRETAIGMLDTNIPTTWKPETAKHFRQDCMNDIDFMVRRIKELR
jgi:hypothetical protein